MVSYIQYFSAKSICQHGVSNLSDLIMASIKYEIGDNSNEKQIDIVIKLLPQDPFGRYFVTINQFDLREIQFYTKVCISFDSYFFFLLLANVLSHVWFSFADFFGFNDIPKCAFENRLRVNTDSSAKMFLF